MSYNATFFLESQADARTFDVPTSVLYIGPDGPMRNTVAFQFPSRLSGEERVAIAERIFATVQQWRDGIVREVTQQRTAAVELAEARAEIARLKGEAEDGAA